MHLTHITHPVELQLVKHKPSTVIIKVEPHIDLTSDLDKEIGAPEVKTHLVLEGKKEFLKILDSDDEMIIPGSLDFKDVSLDASSDLGSLYNFEDNIEEVEEEEVAAVATDWMDPCIKSFIAYGGRSLC